MDRRPINGHAFKGAFGRDEYGLTDFPKKIGFGRYARIYLLPDNCVYRSEYNELDRRSKYKRSWKYYRKTPYRIPPISKNSVSQPETNPGGNDHV